MKHIFVTIFFVTFASVFSIAQSKSDTIIWMPTYKLKWEDFQVITREFARNFAATSTCNILYSYRKSANGYTFMTQAFFDKKKSIVRAGFEDADLLKHEQGHFDVAGLHSLKLLYVLRSRHYNADSVEQKTRKTRDSIALEMYRMQRLYDLETLHGSKEALQHLWSKKIDSACKYYSRLLK